MKLKNLLSLSSLAATSLVFFCSCAGLQNSQFSQSILGTSSLFSGTEVGSILGAIDAGSKGLSGLTVEQEYYLGRAVSARILGTTPLAERPPLNTYLNKVGMVLAAYSERPETFGGYHFAALQSTQYNAVSAPGGFVFVSTGLINLVHDEDMLAAILAHEIGHIVLGHGTKAISAGNFRKAAVILGQQAVKTYGRSEVAAAVSTFSESVDDLTKTLFETGYSRGQEYDADEFAVNLLAKAGYDPKAMLDVLEALQKTKSTGGWFSTHPKPEDRIDEVQSQVKKLPVVNAALRTKRGQRAKGILG